MVIAAGAVLLPALGIHWPGGKDGTGSPQAGNIPDSPSLTALAPEAAAKRARHHASKAKHHAWTVEADGTQIVVRPQSAVPAASLSPVAPSHAAQPTVVVTKIKKPKPSVGGHAVTTTGGPLLTTTVVPTPAAAAASTGLVRLSVRSAGVGESTAGDPELQVKLGITGGSASDALPDTVTLHLRPQIPASLPQNDPSLALQAQVDMVDAQRTTADDPALRMRVRMSIAAAPADTPMVQEPAGGDGKSNVIALTVGLASFHAPDQPAPGNPPPPVDSGPPAPGGPITPGDPDQTPTPTPGDPTPTPGPSDPGSGAPTPGPTPAPGDPAPTPTPDDPGQTDPTPAPTPAPGDPGQPTPTPPPVTTPPPVNQTPAPVPPREILIPVGPVRPIGGTTTVPVTPTDGAAPGAVPDLIPIDVIVEELPPADPTPPDPASVPILVVQTAAPEVPAPPAAGPNPDPGPVPDPNAPPAPDPSAPAADTTVVASYTDAGGALAPGT